MTGLEKIINEIRDEAAGEAKRVMEEANAEAGKIRGEGRAEAEASAAKIKAAAAKEAEDIASACTSALDLQRRQRTLQTKQAVLAETLQKALESLYALPDGPYFDLLLRLAAKAAEPGEGAMLLSPKDAARLPADFAQKLAAALPAGRSLQIAKETRAIDGGFVLKYGDVEENCSFKDLFDARREEFADLVRDTLFA